MTKIRRHPNYLGYGVSRDGQVWSQWRQGGKGHPAIRGVWRRLNFRPDEHGYVNCWIKYENRSIGAHVLVATVFIGSIPSGYVVNHIDGIKHHNSVENLEIVTQTRNVEHAWENGLVAIAKPKLTPDQVRAIRKRCEDGEKQRVVALDFGIDQSGVSDIVKRVTWKHLD